MDEQQLIEEPPLTFCNFIKRIFHHFTHGNAPYNQEVLNFSNSRIPYQFSFDSHSGPIEDAILDAKNLHRSLFIFIYCRHNPLTPSVVHLLQQPSIANGMRENFVFLPLDVTWPEGWTIANQLHFQYMPIIALVRPKGRSLAESNVFVKYEGRVGETTLHSTMTLENHAHRDGQIVELQNDEFNQAVYQDNENERQRQEQFQAQQEEQQRREAEARHVDAEFAQLPSTEGLTDVATIRFQFPDNNARIHTFPRDCSINLLFVFARKFMHPRKFYLLAGFPQFKIEEDGRKLKDVYSEKNFIVHVEEEEETD